MATMTYAIEGLNGEGVIAEVGKLVYLRGAVEWNVVMPDRAVAGPSGAGKMELPAL